MNPGEVNSSVIAKIEYDFTTWELRIVFNKGAEYVYKHVPREIYVELVSSASIGEYFNCNIKNQYKYARQI